VSQLAIGKITLFRPQCGSSGSQEIQTMLGAAQNRGPESERLALRFELGKLTRQIPQFLDLGVALISLEGVELLESGS
jgi:hypothetical protein